MSIPKPASIIATGLLALLFAACTPLCASLQKPDILDQLRKATRPQLSKRASELGRNYAREVTQLALDLQFYRWAASTSGSPIDVRNIDDITAALTHGLGDRTVQWSEEMFAIRPSGKPATLPPQAEERVAELSDLRREYGMALDYRESSPVAAVKALDASLEICRKLHLDLSEALVMAELGDHYYANMSRYREAEVYYNRAAFTFRAYDCVESCALIYDDCGALNEAMSRATEAVDKYTTAGRQWLDLAKQDPSNNRYTNLAGREFMRAGLAQQATGDFEKATRLMVDQGLKNLKTYAYTAKSYSELITNLISVARIYRQRGNAGGAVKLLDEAKKACKAQDDPLLTARVHGELAAAYRANGQQTQADEAESTRTKTLEAAVSDAAAAAAALDKPGSTPADNLARLTRIERGAQACQELRDYARSEETWRKTSEVCAQMGLDQRRAANLRSLATVLDLQKKPQESLQVRLEAITTAMSASRKALARDIGLEMVQALVEAGDLVNALEAFRDLAPIFEDSGDVKGAAWILEGRGKLLMDNGKHEEAIKDFEDARSRYAGQVGDPWAAGAVSIKLAACWQAANEPDKARATLQAALEGVEDRYSSENLDPNVDVKRSQVLKGLYGALAVAYVRADKTEDAGSLLRKGKRYLWMPELVQQMKSDPDARVAQFATTVEVMREDPNSNSLPTPGSPRLLADTWAGLAETSALLREQYPAAYNALPVDPLQGLYRWRNSLPKNGVIVQYMPSGNSVYAFVCGYERAICRELGSKSGDIDRLIADLRKFLKGSEDSLSADIRVPPVDDWQDSSFAEARKPLAGLYTQLVAPLRQDLEGQQLVMFALPEEFAGLPMHALISSGLTRTPTFLVQDFEIGYLAKGMLPNLIGRDSKPIDPSLDRLAIFANPHGNLPGAEEEARTIRSVYFNSQYYLASKASAPVFLEECRKANILHIAAHHRIDPNPARFELRLAPGGDSQGNVGIEELTDVMNPNLALVVLSACDSIASSDPISTGPSCAAEMFAAVGAKSVLGGLWKVSDDAAAKIMGDFYRTLCKGKSRTEALRRAQISAIENPRLANPFYWACFALYGNPW